MKVKSMMRKSRIGIIFSMAAVVTAIVFCIGCNGEGQTSGTVGDVAETTDLEVVETEAGGFAEEEAARIAEEEAATEATEIAAEEEAAATEYAELEEAERYRWEAFDYLDGNKDHSVEWGVVEEGSNNAMAIESLEKAIALGDVESMFWLGSMYRNGHGVEVDNVQAMEWFKKAADAGYVSAMYEIGFMYEFGDGVEQDVSIAKEWYEKADQINQQ